MCTASSARSTTADPRSAVEYTATTSMPSSRQARATRTAISPRFAMSRRLITPAPRSPGCPRGPQQHEDLVVLDRLGVADEDLADHTRVVGDDRVHQLHRLDDPEGLPRLHLVADGDERSGPGGRRGVEGADEGCADGGGPL